MSIDYDQLREWLVEVDRASPLPGDTITFSYPGSTVEIIRELLRLHDGVATVRDRCATLAESAQEVGMHAIAHAVDINAQALTNLLDGDAE